MARVFPWLAVRDEVRERRGYRDRLWEASPTAAGFVEDYYPALWEGRGYGVPVRDCRMRYTPGESQTRGDKWKLFPHACWKVPWCVPCSVAAGRQRLAAVLDKVSLGTPEGRQRRVVPWTLSALVNNEGVGVGMAASRDLGRFAEAARRFFERLYGAGRNELGGFMSYQDFGEQAFRKRNPHWHVTLNGWLWRDGGMVSVPEVDLRGRGRARVSEIWDGAMAEMFPGGQGTNSRVERHAYGRGAYYKWVKYQVRELVDLRKVEYDRDKALVRWLPYHDRHGPVLFGAAAFRDGLEEYRARVRPDRAHRVHRTLGYMRGRGVQRLAKAIGGRPETHDPMTCACNRCDEWLRRSDLRPAAMGYTDAEREWEAYGRGR